MNLLLSQRKSPFSRKFTTAGLLGIALGMACTATPARAQTTYTWNDSLWSSPGSWTPSGPPTIADSVLVNSGTPVSLRPDGNFQVVNFTVNSAAAQTIASPANNSANSLTFTGTLTNSGAGISTFRGNTVSATTSTLSVTAANIAVQAGSINLGSNAVAQHLSGVSVSGDTDVSSGTVLRVNVGQGNTAYSLGNVTNNGTIFLSYAASASAGSGTANVTGLRGSGFIYGALNDTAVTSTLAVTSDATTTYSGRLIDGVGAGSAGAQLAFTKSGSGTQILTGNLNTYSGATTVNGGRLLINNTSGSGTGTGIVTVQNGGAFGGTGIASGAVTVLAGGTLMGGDGVTAAENLALTGNVSLESDSAISLVLGENGTHSTLTRGGGTWVFDSNQKFSFINAGVELGIYDNIINGLNFGTLDTTGWMIQNAGWAGTFAYDGNGGIDLTITAIPEPASVAMLGLGVAVIATCLRRRKNAHSGRSN